MDDIVDRLRIAETAPLDADGKVSLFLVLQDARAEIARLRKKRQWIPVGERLPELDSSVLVAWNYGEDKEQAVSQAWHHRHGLFTSLEDMEFPGVTHWQPLPAPPNGGEVE